MRSSRRSGRLASVRPGAGSTSRQRRSGERDASASQCPSGSAASASPSFALWVAAVLERTDERGDLAVQLDRRREQQQLPLERRQPQQTREPVDRRLEVVRFPVAADGGGAPSR